MTIYQSFSAAEKQAAIETLRRAAINGKSSFSCTKEGNDIIRCFECTVNDKLPRHCWSMRTLTEWLDIFGKEVKTHVD